MNEQRWCSQRGQGPYDVVRVTDDWILALPPSHLSRFGVYLSEGEAIDRAIKDNQRLARKIRDQVAVLKASRMAARATAPSEEEG